MYTRCRFTASLIHWYLGDSSSLKVIKPDHQKEFFWTGFGLCCATWLRIFIFLETELFDTAQWHESISCLPGALTPRVLESRSLNSKIAIACNCLRGEADFILPGAGRLNTGVGGFSCPCCAAVMGRLCAKGERKQPGAASGGYSYRQAAGWLQYHRMP